MNIQCEESKPIDPKLDKIISKHIEAFCKLHHISSEDISSDTLSYLIDLAYSEYEAGIK